MSLVYKQVLFTQRVDIVENYGERRDCADQKISEFLWKCGLLPVPVINQPGIIGNICKQIRPDGILLTGGNDLVDYGGNAPERDEAEKLLLEYAIENSVPLLGICRGMQFISHYFGCKLESVEGHIRQNHMVTGVIAREKVNSFHGRGVRELSDDLYELARSQDGVIEAVRHRKYWVMGVMWHPERVPGFDEKDIVMFKNFYKKQEDLR